MPFLWEICVPVLFQHFMNCHYSGNQEPNVTLKHMFQLRDRHERKYFAEMHPRYLKKKLMMVLLSYLQFSTESFGSGFDRLKDSGPLWSAFGKYVAEHVENIFVDKRPANERSLFVHLGLKTLANMTTVCLCHHVWMKLSHVPSCC